jgi:hypothetical protein
MWSLNDNTDIFSSTVSMGKVGLFTFICLLVEFKH